jgi:flagellar biogenesis protein FliO
MSMFWPSLVVLSCALGVAVLLVVGRFLRERALRSGAAPFRLISRVPLSREHVLYVVETGDRRLLLGGAPGGLSLLTELSRASRPSVASRDLEVSEALARELIA